MSQIPIIPPMFQALVLFYRGVDNSSVISGNSLSDGIDVFVSITKNKHTYACKIHMTREYARDHFIFDPKDGTWASTITRFYWWLHPHSHPNITLFDILCKNLKI
jgi:hypothetical protein